MAERHRIATRPVRIMYLHGVEPKHWARKYGIEPVTAPCQLCGKVQTTTLPMIVGVQRGLAVNCECGSHVPYCWVIPNDWSKGLTGEESYRG